MAVYAEQLDSNEVVHDPLLEAIENNNRIVKARSKLNARLNCFEKNKFATTETIKEYRKAAASDSTYEGLKGLSSWIGQQWLKVDDSLKGLQGQISQGIKDGIMSENDREFLMNRLILTNNYDFVGNISEIEKAVKGKVDRMKTDRKRYDKLMNHPLIKNTGFIKTDANTKIEFPNEKAFIELEVPERRELLEKMEAALPKAEEYAKKHGEAVSAQLTQQYTDLLSKAERKGLLGEKSIDKFLDGFSKIDNEEKAHWVKELQNGNQLERYEDLWRSVRSTFKGEALKRMEKHRDSMGYSELLNAFGDEQDKESQKMDSDYEYRLRVAHQHKLISQHTLNAFAADMRSQPFDKKHEHLDQFENQMHRYTVLRAQVDQIKNPAIRDTINKMYESSQAGFTEINSAYHRLTGQPEGAEPDKTTVKRSDKILSTITSTIVKGEILHSNKVLNTNEKKGFANKIIRFITMKVAKKEDATKYQSKIQKSRLGHEQVYGNAESKAKISVDRTYRQDTFKDEKGIHRVARVGGTKEAVQAFLSEPSLNVEKDDLSLMAKSGNTIVELNTQEKRAWAEYLKAKNEEQALSAANDDEEISLAA